MSDVNFYSASAALAGKERLDVESMELMYQLEVSGEVFYQRLADRMDNPEAAELLRRNGVEERAHARRIAKALSIVLGHEWQPTAAHETILEIPLPDTITRDLFLAVVEGELNGDLGYQKWADAETDDEVAKLLRLNGREESIHADRARRVAELLA
jgi:rubrerythrin